MIHTIPTQCVHFTPLIREKSGGEYEGKPLELFRKAAADKKTSLRSFKGKNGECWNDVLKRASSFILSLAQHHLSSTPQNNTPEIHNDKAVEEQKINLIEKQNVKIIAITHGGFIMEMYNAIDYHQS